MVLSLELIPLYAEFKLGNIDVCSQWLCSTWDEKLFTSSNDDDDDGDGSGDDDDGDGGGSWHRFQATGFPSSPSFDRLKERTSGALQTLWPSGVIDQWDCVLSETGL